VLDKPVRRGKRWKSLITLIAALTLVIGLVNVEYGQYAYAVAWHFIHGNYAEIAGHRVNLPLLWWQENSNSDNTTLLVRAERSVSIEIKVRPAFPDEVRDTTQELLNSTQTFVSNRKSSAGVQTVVSMVTLNPKPFTLYCKREDTGIFTDLRCLAARVPYVFIYDGTPTREREAETILSSLE
jgi:hypothetical protein